MTQISETQQTSGQSVASPVIPSVVVQQAEAVVEGEMDSASTTPEERGQPDVDNALNDRMSEFSTETLEHDVPPPAYGESYGNIRGEKDGFGTQARVADDGRVNININQLNRRMSLVLVPALRQQQDLVEREEPLPPPYVPPSLGGEEGVPPPPSMNVVIQVVGSRGDVQPFVALGKVLKETYGHRVRLATHPNFDKFVRENGLEFFSIGGDPTQLMAFMVKNPGLMPGFDSIRSGDVGKRRKEVGEYLIGCWRSCFEAGDGQGPPASDDTIEDWTTQNGADVDPSQKPFVADCIIANPPSFAHIHCAEKLGIPLHIMFTMPYSPTQAFPHPLANIQSSNADPHLTNFLSYALIDTLTWQGLGDVFNRFRQKTLNLDPIGWSPGLLQRLRIPHTYCWSPALIPKPKDWGQHISIAGFYFLNLASNYTPAQDLKAFLDAGPPPVYIGFGSIVLDDPNAMTELIFEAVAKSGQRALISKGWGGVGADEIGKPDNVFMLGNVPHDWLFKYVSCVVHHGGAGTTAAGIAAGRPTVVVPFFGDQPFWGSMVARAGAGPQPIPNKQLTSDNLAEAIRFCLTPDSRERAQELASKIANEKGTDTGAQTFHQNLHVDDLRCNVCPSRAAVWRIKRTDARLSAFAACTLANEGLLDFRDLKLFRAREYEADEGPVEPISGASVAVISTVTTMLMGVADFPVETLKALKIHPDATKKNANGDKTLEAESSKTPSITPKQEVSAQASEEQSKRQSSSTAATSLQDTEVRRSLASMEDTSSGQITPATDQGESGFNVQESLASIHGTSLASSPASEQPQPLRRMPTSMRQALTGELNTETRSTRSRSRSCSRSRSRARSQSRSKSSSSPKPSSKEKEREIPDIANITDTTIGTSKGLRRILDAGLTSPMDVTMALARGFHNAPKLYGDDTVRKVGPVTDMKSGLKVSAKELGLGFYDGISGLVTQPMRGARKEGAAGMIKGIGKGIAGLPLKTGAAFFSFPGYIMRGVYKEIQRQFGASVHSYIVAARTAQGYDDWQNSTPQERQDTVIRWKTFQSGMKKKRNPDEVMRDMLDESKKKHTELMTRWNTRSHTRAASTGQVRRGTLHPENSDDPEDAMLDMGSPLSYQNTPSIPMAHANTYSAGDQIALENTEMEDAMRISAQEADQAVGYRGIIAASSNQNPSEDAEMAEAIRMSMAQLDQPDLAEQRLPQHLVHPAEQAAELPADQMDDHEDGEQLRQAVRASLLESQQKTRNDDEDEALRQALETSRREAEAEAQRHGREEADVEAELAKVLERSLSEQ